MRIFREMSRVNGMAIDAPEAVALPARPQCRHDYGGGDADTPDYITTTATGAVDRRW